MFVIRFIRNDGKPDEEYYYNKREDAEYHISLFESDDSGLYTDITIFCTNYESNYHTIDKTF